MLVGVWVQTIVLLIMEVHVGTAVGCVVGEGVAREDVAAVDVEEEAVEVVADVVVVEVADAVEEVK